MTRDTIKGLYNIRTRGLIVALSGPSGVGKGSVISKLMELRPDIVHALSATTRKPRHGEIDGVHYHFTDKENFESMIENDKVLEYDTYCGNYYGTLADPLYQTIEKGQDVILDVTVAGSLTLLEKIPGIVSIFLLPPSFEELSNRLIGRGTEDEVSKNNRLIKARQEIIMTENFEYVIVNDDLNSAASKIIAILSAEKSKYSRLQGIENRLLD